ncbi:phage holin family protein [Gulosibacter sp. ACHW.36C]|jgi:putative membrane protein|uniref:Phage holin family protein n=1 Tax=Gulosibacter sediminis TaxID=1729695 RepID=A0ABY4MXM2_9MICO|nr:phage holin family protein [Gulosibacter sediminis]UQN14779.1 phage holin family protein [Gulosibacter sediminis]
MRFLASIVLNAVALWATVWVLQGGLTVTAYDDSQASLVLTYLLLAVVWGLVNAVIGSVVRIVSMPLYCLTLGLFALVVNGFLFWLVGWVSGLLDFGLTIDNFWWAIGGAIIMGILSAILNGIFRTRKRDRRREVED